MYILRMIRERLVILKAVLHFRLAVLVAASYIITVLPINSIE